MPNFIAELQSHLPAYEETGVKYVVAPVGLTVWTGNGPRPPKVYSDSLMDIYQLPRPQTLFSDHGGSLRANYPIADRHHSELPGHRHAGSP